jgi:caffeoyl-CoA O-methyltransferase
LEIIDPLAEAYAEKLTNSDDPLLSEIAAFTMQNHPQHHMLSGAVQGRLLAALSRMIRPEYVLEIGTFTGYTALCLAEGLRPGGALHTLELRADVAALARAYFNRSARKDALHLHLGDAAEILPKLQPIWDLVFIDADKANYIRYYETVLPRVKSGGWLIADNVLFHGQVWAVPPRGKNASAIHDFNEHVKQDGRVEQVMVTVRDGLLIMQKK